jgi:hypothetical protein
MRLTVTLSFLALMVSSCGGGATGPRNLCSKLGAGCASNADCCMGTCNGGVCTATCQGSGAGCASTAECCMGLICTANKCAAPPTCAGSGGACAQTADCCAGQNLTCTAGKCGATTCRNAADPCAATADCCNPLLCSAGRCGMQNCRGLGDACEVTADCCNPLVCAGGKCATMAQCRTAGQACANTNDCCQGLVCLTGQCADGTQAVVMWIVTDNCFNGETIQYRFFDETDNLVWPDNTHVYLANGGQVLQSNLSCKQGNTICIGANQPNHNLEWSVGIANTTDYTKCQNCSCFVCDNGQGTTTFTCP